MVTPPQRHPPHSFLRFAIPQSAFLERYYSDSVVLTGRFNLGSKRHELHEKANLNGFQWIPTPRNRGDYGNEHAWLALGVMIAKFDAMSLYRVSHVQTANSTLMNAVFIQQKAGGEVTPDSPF